MMSVSLRAYNEVTKVNQSSLIRCLIDHITKLITMRELGVDATTAMYRIHIGVYNILYMSDSLDRSEILVQGGQR